MKSGHSLVGRRLTVLLPAILVLVEASSAFGQYLPVNPSGYQIIPAPESPTAFLSSSRGFQWIDNDRLLFLANDRDLSVTKKDGNRTIVKKAVPTIHLWDFRAATIQRYQPEPFAQRLCVVDAWARYGLKRNDETVIYEGPFGQERARTPTPPRIATDGQQISPQVNPFTCREYWFTDLPRPNKGRSFPLKEADGLLEDLGWNPTAEQPSDNALSPPFRRWLHFDNRSIELSFPQERISSPTFSKFLDAYVFIRPDDRIDFGKSNRWYVLFRKDWEVISTEIPGSLHWKQLHNIAVTRAGIVAESTATSQPRVPYDPGPSGLYLFFGPVIDGLARRGFGNAPRYDPLGPGIHYERINKGLVDSMSSASPDGCKVVNVIDPWHTEKRQLRLEAVDFCSKRR
jgi:hypothetical protein